MTTDRTPADAPVPPAGTEQAAVDQVMVEQAAKQQEQPSATEAVVDTASTVADVLSGTADIASAVFDIFG